jgi:hypothetical protein
MITCAARLTRMRLGSMPRCASISISEMSVRGLTTTPLPMTGVIEYSQQPVRRNHPDEVALSVNDSQSGFSMANRAPRGNLLIDARGDNRGSGVHQRFHVGLGGGQQERFNRHDAEECVSLTHDNVACALIRLPNQVFSDVAHPLEGASHRDARGGKFGSRFEGHGGLALRWPAGLYSVHRPIPSCNCVTRASRAELPQHPNDLTPSRARCGEFDGKIANCLSPRGQGLCPLQFSARC